MSWGLGRRVGSDLALLWLWRRPAAVAPIRPLAWEPPYAAGAALKRPKKKEREELVRFKFKVTLFSSILIKHLKKLDIPLRCYKDYSL